MMCHGRTIFPTLIVLAAGLSGFTLSADGSEPTDNRLGERTVPIFLLIRADIQADLKLSPEQVTECRRAALAFQRKAARLIGRKDAAVVPARREIDEELNQWLTQHLSPQQFARFEQIDLQWEGAAAMISRPFLDDSLKLTPEQKKTLSECLAQRKLQRARGTWTYDDHTNLTRKAIAVLTDTQREVWVRLLGPRCQFMVGATGGESQSQPASVSSIASPPQR
jgi:hypothetical protein